MALYVGNTRYKVMVGNQKHDFVVPLPYDAEVEWLQSDGNAYIDTGIKVAGNLSANVYLVDFFTSESVGRSVFGGLAYIEEGEWDYDIRQFGFGINQDGKAVFYYDGSSIVLDDYSTYPQYARVVIENGVISIGSEQYAYTPASFTTPMNVILFGWNNGLIFNTPCKMGPCYLSDGTTTLDLIPVRKDGVGYMYDKISGKLFGREETGNFIIGPDKNLPYDAEVEYLESSGTQWIDTGIGGNQNTKVEVSFKASAIYKYLLGSRSNTTTCITLYIYTSSAYQRFGNHSASKNISLNTNHILSIDKSYCILDGVSSNVGMDGSFTTPTNLLLMNVSGLSQSASTPFQGRVYYCKIWDNGNLVRDFIPVRKNGVGYMYDKVSRQLFGNAGTGNFILGNDVTT